MINEKRMMIEALNIANVEIATHRKIVSAKKRILNDIADGKETIEGEAGTDIIATLLLETLYSFKSTRPSHKISYLVSRVLPILESEIAWKRISAKLPGKEENKYLVNFINYLNTNNAKNLKLGPNTKFNLIKLLNKQDSEKMSSKNPLRPILRSKTWNAFGAAVASDVTAVRGILFAALLEFFTRHPHYQIVPDGRNVFIVTKTEEVNSEVKNYMFTEPQSFASVRAFKFNLSPSIHKQSIEVALASSYTFDADYNNAVKAVIASGNHWKYFDAENAEALKAKVESVEADVENGLRFWDVAGNGTVYFKYVVDFRGRISQLGGLSAVGHKVGKAMLRSGSKLSLGEHGYKHIILNLAGAMGHDKSTFAERLVWANDNVDKYVAIGGMVIDNPVEAFKTLYALDADDIFNAASICLELYRISNYKGNTEDFESDLFVGYDATCSGLQIVSLLWGNKMLAENTNVAAFEGTENKIYDIYKYLYEGMDKIAWDDFNAVTAATPDGEELLEVWIALDAKVKRGIAKKLLMPRIYGSTFRTWAGNTRKEAGKKNIFGEIEDEAKRESMIFQFGIVIANLFKVTFDKEPGFQAFRDFDTVVGQVATAYNSKKMDTRWTLNESSTFENHVIVSAYRKLATARYFVYHNGAKIDATSYGVSIFEEQVNAVSKVNKKVNNTRKAKNAISPNFVHSLDALLLHTVNYSMKTSMRLTHDCFACTAGQAERLLETIDNTFSDLFGGRNNLIKKLADETFENTGVEINVPETLKAEGIAINNIQKGIYKFS